MTRWFESTAISLTFLGFSQFYWRFWDFAKFRWPFLGISLNLVDLFWAFVKCPDSNQLMNQTVSQRLETIQLMTQLAFQVLTQNQLMTQVDSSCIDSDWLLIQSASPFFDSNQLMTQAKSIWFWVESWFDSESYPCLVGGEAEYMGSAWEQVAAQSDYVMGETAWLEIMGNMVKDLLHLSSWFVLLGTG